MDFSNQVTTSSRRPIESSELKEQLQRIQRNLTKDLQAPMGRFFSAETREEIHRKAAQELTLRLNQIPHPPTVDDLQKAWQEVVEDYYRSEQWSFPTVTQAPRKEQTQDQKVRKELVSYIGFLVVVLFIVKSAFYIFGMLGSNYQDEPSFFYGFWISLFLLFSVTLYFGWKKIREPQ